MSLRPTWKICLCLVAIFAAGLVIGSLATIGFIRHKLRQSSGDAPKVAQTVMHRLEKELRLSPGQVEKIRPAILQAGERLHALQVEGLVRAHQIFVEAEAGIAPHLDERQKARLQELIAERREQLRRTFGKELSPPGRPPGPAAPP